MKITKTQLKQIIQEEIEKVISADDLYLAEMFNTMSVPDEDTEAFKNCPKGQWQYGEKDEFTRKPTYGWCKKPIQEKEELEEEKDWMKSAFSKKKGSLHKALGVPEDKDISVTKMASALRKGGKTEKKARAAVNANPDKYGSIKDVGVEKKKKKTKK